MTYVEYKKKIQDGFNTLPIFYAFGMKQFKEQMEQRGLTENDTDKIRQFYGGGIYLVKDEPIIKAWLDEYDNGNKLKKLMKNPKFAEEAFLYEMNNHEYAINWQGDWDVCSCFGNPKYSEDKTGVDYLKDMGFGTETITAYLKARKRHYKLAENW